MKTKKLFTSLAAAVMLSAGLAGVAQTAQPVQAQTTNQAKKGSVSVKRRTVSVTVHSDKPVLFGLKDDNKFEKVDSTYTKGQAINAYYSIDVTATSQSGQSQTITLYYIGNQTVNGKDTPVFIPSTDVTTSASVPTQENWVKQAQSDQKAIQDAYNNRTQYIVVTPKSKKGSKIYYAYLKSRKSKKVYFKASKKKIKHGKKIKAVSVSKKSYQPIVKVGKKRYVYIGKKRYLNWSSVKATVKTTPLQLSDDLKNLIVEN